MSLKYVLVAMALPPMCFLYFTIAGVLLWNRRWGRPLAALGAIGLTMFAMPVFGGWLLHSLEQDLTLTPPPGAMPKAIVILGGDVARIEGPPFALPGLLTLDRLRAGAALHRRTGLPILVTGGIIHRDRLAVGQIMATSLRDDFRAEATWVEDKSADTWENAVFSAEILKRQGISSVYVVTDAWHMPRAEQAFRKVGLTVTAAPTLIDASFDLDARDFVPRVSTWLSSYFAMHEWVGRLWYARH